MSTTWPPFVTCSSDHRLDARDGARRRADLLDRHDASAADGEDRLDRERRPEQRRGGADASAAAQVLEGVDVEQDAGGPEPRVHGLQDLGHRRLPSAAASAAATTANPMAMPMVSLSTTSTGTGASAAASRAASTVPDICDDRWTETMAVAPSSASRWYVSAKTCGVGRDVVTMVYSRSAAATCVRRDVPALDEVLTADDDVERDDLDAVPLDDLPRQVGRRVGDDPRAHVALLPSPAGRGTTAGTTLTSLGARTMTVRMPPSVAALHLVTAERQLAQVVLGDVGAHLDPVADLALDLDDAGDGVLDELRGVAHGERRHAPPRPRDPSRCHISSAMCGATGATMSTIASTTSRGGASSFVRALLSSMSLAMAVLKRSPS